MPLISVTRLRVRSFLFLPQFLWDTIKSVRQVERSNGFLGGRLLVNAGYVFWTMTAWQDESAMKAYRTGGAHRKAMPQLLDWCDEAAVVHWIQQSAEIPMWPEAHQHMLEKGKLHPFRRRSRFQPLNPAGSRKPSNPRARFKPDTGSADRAASRASAAPREPQLAATAAPPAANSATRKNKSRKPEKKPPPARKPTPSQKSESRAPRTRKSPRQ